MGILNRRIGLVIVAFALCAALVGCQSTPAQGDSPRADTPKKAPASGKAAPADAPASSGDDERIAHAPPPDGGPVAGGAAGNPILEEYAKDRTLRQKESRAVSDHYFKVGKKFYDQLDYREAEKNFRIAFESDPTNKEAEQFLLLSQLLIGKRDSVWKVSANKLAEQRDALIEQKKIEVERLYNQGLLHFEAREFDRSIERFEQVIEQIQWFPYKVDDADLRSKAKGKIDEANSLKRQQDLAEREARQEQAFARAQKEVDAVIEREQRKVQRLMARVIEYLKTDQYDKAEQTADEVLTIDPDNSTAHKLRDHSIRGRHVMEQYDTIITDLEERKRDVENNHNAAIPYADWIRWPNKEQWDLISSRHQGIALQESEEAFWIQNYRKVLKTRKVTLNFPDTPLSDVIQFLQDITGLNITVASSIDAEDITISLTLRDIRLEDALNIILEQAGLAKTFSNETLLITEPEEAVGEVYLDILDVQDILSRTQDFPGPTIQVSGDTGGGGGGGGGGAAGAGTLVFDDEEEGLETGIDADKLIELLEGALPETAFDPEGSSLEIHRGQLLLNSTREVHREVTRILDNLRKNSGLFVQVETRFVLIHDDFLQDFGIDYRGLGLGNPSFGTPLEFVPSPTGNQRGQPGAFADDVGGTRTIPTNPGTRIGPQGVNNPLLGADNVGFRQQNVFERGAPFLNGMRLNPIAQNQQQSGLSLQTTILEPFQLNAILTAEREFLRERLVQAPTVVAADRQRVHTAVVTQRAYIADFELSSGGTGLAIAEVADPIVEVFQEGIVLDVRPTISHDRKYITLDMRPTLATLVGGDFTQIPVNLGTISMAAINVNIEVPAIILQEAFTSVTIPDGGSALVGGFRQFDERILRSSTPFVDSVPILNVLAKREGELRETESLVILVTAKILSVREEEAKHFNRR